MFFDRGCRCGCNPCACCQMECTVMEPVVTKCIEKEFFHEVPHVCPVHTHVVNRHIYRHTYTPQYTTSEEEVVVNEDCGSCCNFR